MINLTEEKWEELYDAVDKTIIKAQEDLPEAVRLKAEDIPCNVTRYSPESDWKILGRYMAWTKGPIIIYVGQIYEDCGQNIEEAMKSVRQVYYHELAHAVGSLVEWEVKERGL